ncbi:MerR family transcriptional regulator [Nocardia huaxiensis]|uniref:MerR family transcriptional regulator n=1 Tax=Nocardia huaxiensis TaxID=2755382 RepID=A0A7D6ZLF1_9NOCA|nr:MerR family transcriptional regulator [Nocardia huaxiensis]QLY28465.1 MerR family transcriptional regulator [Nocardia huaxiensis]
MTTAPLMRIGDAAAVLGLEAHVLRHWESMGLLHPPRSASGHRVYDEQTLNRARMIRILQRTGLSLDQIRQLAISDRADRLSLVDGKRAEIRERIDLLQATDRFLTHLLTCSHRIVAECPDCLEFTTREYAQDNGFSAQPAR